MDAQTPTSDPIPAYPCCGAAHVARNGTLRSGFPNPLCRGCGRNFVSIPKRGPVAQERKALIRRLLLERLSLRAVARLARVPRFWLQRFVDDLYREQRPWEPTASLKKELAGLILEADEMWSYVGSRREGWWILGALDAETRRVGVMVCGDRSEYAARCLCDALPDDYRAGAVVFSDFWAAYAAVIPDSRHVACGKGDGMTCHVERFWRTVRQRCARFVRKTLSFSKCPSNHVGSLWYFIHHCNVSRR